MAKRKKNKNKSKNTTHTPDPGPSTLWRVVKILLLLGVGYALGWNFGYVSGRDTALEASGSGSTSGGASNTDAYGRSPGHPHYGHAHN